jgi:hypothetical protein
MCSKGLRLVTVQPPEKSWPIGTGLNRTSPLRRSKKFAAGSWGWHHDEGLMATRNPPGTGMLRLSAAVLFVAGPILALFFRSWGLGALVFGLGAIVLGIRQVRLGGHRSERFLGVALLLGGAFSVIDGVVRLLLGASP